MLKRDYKMVRAAVVDEALETLRDGYPLSPGLKSSLVEVGIDPVELEREFDEDTRYKDRSWT